MVHEEEKGKRIGVTTLTHQHLFYQDFEKGLAEEAKKWNDEVEIVRAEFDPKIQAKQVEDFIAKKVDALVICPCDSLAIGKSIAKANEAGIPVFTADIANSSKEGKVISHITSDNVQGGRLAARLLARAMGYQGKVAIINHPGITSVSERVKGFREAIAQYPEIEIVADVPAWGQREKAVKVTRELLQNVPNLTGIFGINDDSILGALQVVKEAKLIGKIILVGYDANPEARAAIAMGEIYADARQHPIKLGQECIKTIHDYFRGFRVPPVVLVEVGTWT